MCEMGKKNPQKIPPTFQGREGLGWDSERELLCELERLQTCEGCFYLFLRALGLEVT